MSVLKPSPKLLISFKACLPEQNFLSLLTGAACVAFAQWLLPETTPKSALLFGSNYLLGMFMVTKTGNRLHTLELVRGNPKLISPPGGFTHQLPCEWRTGTKWTQGVLYLGPQHLHFEPIASARKKFEPLILDPTTSIQASLTNDKIPQLQIVSPTNSAKFKVPTPIDTLDQLNLFLDESRRANLIPILAE